MSPPEDLTTQQLGPEAYRAMYDFSPYGVLFTSPDGRVLAANPAACDILRRDEAEICALGRQGLVDLTDDRWTPLLVERERTGNASGVARMIRGDGSAIEVEVSARIFTDGAGQRRSCTVIRDVTERVRGTRELIESRASLAEAERVGRMGSWEWDLVNNHTTWSDGLLHLYGLARDQFDATLEEAMRRVYPEDRELLRRTLGDAISRRSSFSIEYRGLRSDGRVRTLRGQGDVVVDDAGKPVRLVGVVQDVTDARLAQQLLQSTSADLERRASELQQLALGSAAEQDSGAGAVLTARQLAVVQLIAQGLTNAEIARRLYVSEGTIKWHVKQILAKTGSANRAEAVARVLGEPG